MVAEYELHLSVPQLSTTLSSSLLRNINQCVLPFLWPSGETYLWSLPLRKEGKPDGLCFLYFLGSPICHAYHLTWVVTIAQSTPHHPDSPIAKTVFLSWTWWDMLVILGLTKLRQEDHKLKCSLLYTVRQCLKFFCFVISTILILMWVLWLLWPSQKKGSRSQKLNQQSYPEKWLLGSFFQTPKIRRFMQEVNRENIVTEEKWEINPGVEVDYKTGRLQSCLVRWAFVDPEVELDEGWGSLRWDWSCLGALGAQSACFMHVILSQAGSSLSIQGEVMHASWIALDPP